MIVSSRVKTSENLINFYQSPRNKYKKNTGPNLQINWSGIHSIQTVWKVYYYLIGNKKETHKKLRLFGHWKPWIFDTWKLVVAINELEDFLKKNIKKG